MDKPELSVIIPAYNCAHCITDAVFSVYAQTCGAHEIIVVNDGSTDKTREVVSSLGQKVRLLSQMNQGPGEARNLGANVAKGVGVCSRSVCRRGELQGENETGRSNAGQHLL
jgi:glycosyltransferase involved in cell wall biosynthesis